MSAAPPIITYGPNAGGHPRNRDRSVIVHFLVGDSIGAGLGASSGVAPGIAPPNCYIWGQNAVEDPATRVELTPNAASRVLPYGSGHGLLSGGGDNSIDPGSMLCHMLAAHTNPAGEGAGAGVDHVFASWAFSGAQMNTTPFGAYTGLHPSATPNTNGYDAFVTAHSLGLLNYIASRGKWAGHVYIGGLFMCSVGGDGVSSGEPSFVAGAAAAYAANCTAFINAFRTAVGMTSANLPVIFGRVPTVAESVTEYDNVGTLQTQTDTLDGSNGITVVSLDGAEKGPDGIHRTAKGYGQVAGYLKAGFDSAVTTCALWPGV